MFVNFTFNPVCFVQGQKGEPGLILGADGRPQYIGGLGGQPVKTLGVIISNCSSNSKSVINRRKCILIHRARVDLLAQLDLQCVPHFDSSHFECFSGIT